MLEKLLRDVLSSELFKYFVSGVIAFIADFTTLLLLTEVGGLHYLVSNIASYSTGLVVSYWLNTRWVFRYRHYEDQSHKEFIIFAAIAFSGLLLSELTMYWIVEGSEIDYRVAKFLSGFFIFAFNFLVKRWLLFKPR